MYQSLGDYTVSLTASGPGGSHSRTYRDLIHVTIPLTAMFEAVVTSTAQFSASPITGIIPLTVHFQDKSSLDVKSWEWQFGLGENSISTAQNPIYTYTQAGLYSVSLKVSNPGSSQTILKQDYIVAQCPKPSADFEVFITDFGTSLNADFKLDSYQYIDQTLWDFGDGETGISFNPYHEYSKAGTYSVSVTVSGPCGSATKVRENIITLLDPPPKSNFIGNETQGMVPHTVTYTDQSKGKITSWFWQFGDGGTSYLQYPTYTYQKAGKYTVQLTTSGPGGSDTKTINQYIIVYSPPPTVADFYALSTLGLGPLTVQFQDTSYDEISTWQWDFGDGMTSNDQHPSHEYSMPGFYTVTLHVKSSTGSASKQMINYIQVKETPPQSNFSLSKTSGTAPLLISFKDLSQGNITQWLWDFGDGETSSNANPTHLYQKPGIYSVALTVIGPGGSHKRIQTDIINPVYPALKASFSASSLSGNAPLAVRFRDASVGQIINRVWEFSDGDTRSDKNPVKVFTSPGQYFVSLTISGPDGHDTYASEKPIIVHPSSKESFLYQTILFESVNHYPWHFNQPSDLVGDTSGTIYVADTGNHRLLKMNAQGEVIAQWGAGKEAGLFYYPMSVTIAGNGNIYVADSGNHRIQQFSKTGEWINAWGHMGQESGQFFWPSGIASYADQLYVADEYNHRIQVFTQDGQWVRSWGEKGESADQFNQPCDIAIDSEGRVFIADRNHYRVQEYTLKGDYISTLKGHVDSSLFMPVSIMIDQNDVIYVSDTQTSRIIHWTNNDSYGRTWRQYSDHEMIAPSGMMYSNDSIYIADTGHNRVQRLSIDGDIISEWQMIGENPQALRFPLGMAMNSQGEWYASNYGANQVNHYSKDGQFIDSWGIIGKQPGEFNGPTDIAINSQDQIYILDKNNHRVQKFTRNKDYITQWGNQGTDNSDFNYPLALAIGPSDDVYVADTENHRVQRFSSEGVFKLSFGADLLRNPSGLAVDRKGNVYVSDFGHERIVKFDSQGRYDGQWEIKGFSPRDIYIDMNGLIYVTDITNSQIQKFTQNGDLIATIGNYGIKSGQLRNPSYLFVTPYGDIYIADTGNHRIQPFRPIDLREAIFMLQVLSGMDIPVMNWQQSDHLVNQRLNMQDILNLLLIISNNGNR